MSIHELNITEDSFDIFVQLSPTDKLEYLWDSISKNSSFDVDDKFEKRLETYYSDESDILVLNLASYQFGEYKINILTADNIIIVTSNKLRLLRNYVKNLWNNGYILRRRCDIRKVPDYYTQKYFMVYEILGHSQVLSVN